MDASCHNASIVFNLRVQEDNRSNNEEENCESTHGSLLCLLYCNGKLGAAYYNCSDKTLNLYEEMFDISPQFLRSASIYREVSPKHLLTFGTITDVYVKALIDFSHSDIEATVSSTIQNNSLKLPDNFFLMSLKDFAYEISKTIVLNITVLSNNLDRSDVKQKLYGYSLINLNHRLSVQALAALYKFIEKNYSMFGFEAGNIHFFHINHVTLRNHVLMDKSTFKSLQIFSQKCHEATFKRGEESSSREGLSIYKLFLSSCKSKLGQSYLRSLLLSPINNYDELKKRLAFIKFAQDPLNSDFISNVQDNIKHLSDLRLLSEILEKIYNARANNRHWKTLYNTIVHIIHINDICKIYRNKSVLLKELNDTITDNLVGLQGSIGNALDFSAGMRRGRPVIKFGLDYDLDAKLLRQQDIAKHVSAAARCAVNDLPDFVNECQVIYLPEMGHHVAIREWEPNCNINAFEDLGYQFMFNIGGTIHYKTPLCVEMDQRLGDINGDIIDHENRILRRLASFILKYNNDIREPLRLISLIDCLIAMAKVSLLYNYVEPVLNTESRQEMVKSRHPLMEQILTSFEPNDFYSGGRHSRMKIVMGANGSGKSIFLRQIALVVYMAHIGCFVPAETANIGLVHSIHCCGQLSESAIVRLSSFMIDIAQTTEILHYASPNSIILLDEFARGTLAEDGIALLAGFLKTFLDQKENCPHVVVSTHLHRITSLLNESKYLEYFRTEHTIQNETFCFLYKISKGVSKSHAFDIASKFLSPQLIQRAKLYTECLQNNATMPYPEGYLAESVDDFVIPSAHN
ncbi:hypothetical protein GWI33_015165 [Rhynchophorus ferrugineus]|uniref:DNA mismatch repair proteins mutS family domain-containing protein n=1 Tax=Rhynchophorus ferrugineus TaxID=354439 RepID=A0A834M8D1_RHYFE|nr:hypothetical protein GWI33_015165 [Rhynchophorus ferrugineus]